MNRGHRVVVEPTDFVLVFLDDSYFKADNLDLQSTQNNGGIRAIILGTSEVEAIQAVLTKKPAFRMQ